MHAQRAESSDSELDVDNEIEEELGNEEVNNSNHSATNDNTCTTKKQSRIEHK